MRQAASLKLREGTTPISDVAPISAASFLDRCFGNLELAELLLDELESTGIQRLEEIQEYGTHRDDLIVSELSHTLKGVAGILCAAEIEKVASDLEQAAVSSNTREVESCISHLDREMHRCLDFLPELRRELKRISELD